MKTIKNSLHAYAHLLDDDSARAHRLTLLLIIIGGFLLRLYSLSAGQAYTYFAINDEVTALKYALGFMAGDPHMLYLGSPALNQGHIPGPLWTMLVAAFYKMGGNSAEGAILGMILLNTVAIYLVYRLARALLPNRYALLSTLLYSFSPWGIYYSAGLYNPIPLALLGAVLFLSLWRTIQQDHSRMIFWVCLFAAAIPQFHMIGIFYLPVILLLLYLSPCKLNYRWFMLGILIGALLYLPYMIGDYLNGWQNTRAMLHGEKHFSFGIVKIITIPIAMLANHPGQWAGPAFADFKVFANHYFGSYVVLTAINLISLILSATFIFSLIRKAWSCWRAQAFRLKTCYAQHPETMFVVILLFLPLLLYTLTGRAYTTRYSIMIFPLLTLLPAMFLYRLPLGRLKNAVGYSLAFMFCINLYMVISFYHDQQQRLQTSTMFMPSFAHLAKIKHSLDTVMHNNQHAVFSFSPTIQKLPEGQHKLYLTISDYMAAYQKTDAAQHKVKLLVMQATDKTADLPGAKIVYTSPAIKILQLADSNR